MSTLKDLISNTSYFSEHICVDVHYYVGKIGRIEAVPFGRDIHRRIDCAPIEFLTPKGVHLYGLLKHPLNGKIYAFFSSEERDLIKAKWAKMAEKKHEEDSEWRVSYRPRKKYRLEVNDSITYDQERVIVYYNAFETNKRRH